MSDDFKTLEGEEVIDELETLPTEEVNEETLANAPVVAGDSSRSEAPIYSEREHFGQTLKNLVNLLPDQYNKEVTDTNYYKLLRSLALEFSNAKIEVQQLREDMSLKTVQPDRIYDNFGTLIKLQKNADWDSEKYRRLIQGVMQSLLRGPTKQSLIDGLNLFTDFKINVYELFKEEDRLKVDPSIFKDVDYQYSFVLEIEKPVEAFADQQALIRDANYIVNIIKPAHTISIIITTIVGEESYRQWYRERFNIDEKEAGLTDYLKEVGLPDYFEMDNLSTEAEIDHTDNIYGYKYKDDGVFGVGSIIGGPDLIGPVYFLKDERTDWYFEQWLDELFEKPETHMTNIGLEYVDELSSVDQFKDYVTRWQMDHEEKVETLLMGNHLTGMTYEVSDRYKSISNSDIYTSYTELFKEEKFILNVELEEQVTDNHVSLVEAKFSTPKDIQETHLLVDWAEDYSRTFHKGRWTLTGPTAFGSMLNGQDGLTGISPDELINTNIEFREKLQVQFFKDIFEHTINWDQQENAQFIYSIIDTFENNYQYAEKLDTSKMSDSITQHDTTIAESVNVTTKVVDTVASYYEAPIYTEDYEPKSDKADSGFEHSENIGIVVMENVPRFTFNQSTIGQARLGGVIRDQVTMVAG